MTDIVNRREVLTVAGTSLLAGLSVRAWAVPPRRHWELSAFSLDITPPLGHPLLAGMVEPAARVVDPLHVHGAVLTGASDPVVFVAVDWCEIRNDAYDAWREAIAAAAETKSECVLLASVHQHDAPLADLTAQRLLEEAGLKASICDLEFHAETLHRLSATIRGALSRRETVSHIGTGSAVVEKVASNRRFIDSQGNLRFDRGSATTHAEGQRAPEETIDPLMRTLSFWDGKRPLAALSSYATHPMSYYGGGGVSSDFVGLARRQRQQDLPQVAQVYFSGAAGNVTAGKYNDGSELNRPVLTGRMHTAMVEAWNKTERRPLDDFTLRRANLELPPRESPGFTHEDLAAKLTPETPPRDQSLAAMGLSWRRRVDAGQPLEVPCVDFGPAAFVLLPAEAYVEYQLFAQQSRIDDFVIVSGYGECAPGYIPTEQHWEEGDGNLNTWCWVAPGAEQRLKGAIREALGV